MIIRKRRVLVVKGHATRAWCPMPRRHTRNQVATLSPRTHHTLTTHEITPHSPLTLTTHIALTNHAQVRRLGRPAHRHRVAPPAVEGGHPHEWLGSYGIGWRVLCCTVLSRVNVWAVGRTPAHTQHSETRERVDGESEIDPPAPKTQSKAKCIKC